ncbi:MAG TPA: protein tyrosine phosphatase family protein [Vicinamibacterales bacterium]|nr:protein tyrosine phosphatase family protein [Vicinamibacterales bacterium]
MRALFSSAFVVAVATSALAQQVTSETVPGVTNFKKLDTTIACAGATTAQGVPELKKMGYASIINLRLPTENGANIDEEAAAAKESGITFIHIPMNGQSPDAATADKFLDAITAKQNQPAFVHCASGNRAAAMWMIKRLAVDHWDVDRASTEASALGLTNQGLKQFAIDYSAAHKR